MASTSSFKLIEERVIYKWSLRLSEVLWHGKENPNQEEDDG